MGLDDIIDKHTYNCISINEDIKSDIIDYVNDKLKEQRLLCAKNHPLVCIGFDRQKIINAPKPELD